MRWKFIRMGINKSPSHHPIRLDTIMVLDALARTVIQSRREKKCVKRLVVS